MRFWGLILILSNLYAEPRYIYKQGENQPRYKFDTKDSRTDAWMHNLHFHFFDLYTSKKKCLRHIEMKEYTIK